MVNDNHVSGELGSIAGAILAKNVGRLPSDRQSPCFFSLFHAPCVPKMGHLILPITDTSARR